MRHFGIQIEEIGNQILIDHQDYNVNDFTVESDWSAASYYFSLVASSVGSEITLSALFENSLQGDSAIVKLAKSFGVHSEFNNGTLKLRQSDSEFSNIQIDFLEVPDIAQTFAVMAAMQGKALELRNLDTLVIKETDRIKALQIELAKCGVQFRQLIDYDYVVDGKIEKGNFQFATYDDHRMAMAFAPIALLSDIIIEEPQVVSKSYPGFWQDLENLGFILEWM